LHLCVSRMIFLYCLSVRPKGIQEVKGLVSEICLDPVMFIASMPKSIICIGVWSSEVFGFCFLVRPKELRRQENLSTEIGSTSSRSLLLYCPDLSSLVVCEKAPEVVAATASVINHLPCC